MSDSDSSSNDVFSLLPGGGGRATGARGQTGRPMQRRTNFAAMINDSDSDSDAKFKPTPAKTKQAAPPKAESSGSDSDSGSSIDFEVSAPPAAAQTNAQGAPKEASKKTNEAKPVARKDFSSSSSSSSSENTQSFKAVPVVASPPPPKQEVASSTSTPVAVKTAETSVASPLPAPVVSQEQSPQPQARPITPPPQQPLPSSVPAPSIPAPAAPSAPAPPAPTPAPVVTFEPVVPPPPPPQTTTYSAYQNTSVSAAQQGNTNPTFAPQLLPATNPPPPTNTSAVDFPQRQTPFKPKEPALSLNRLDRDTTGVDELLARAQQRLRERQYNTANSQAATTLRAASPMMTARAGTPLRSMASPAAAGRYGSVGRPPTPSTTLLMAPPLLPPDLGKESRAQKENQRLADEVTFLASENNRLRNNPASLVTAASTVEITKLELQLEMAQKQCRDVEVEGQRTRRVLEEQIRDISEHRNTLQEEIAACLKSVSQFEQMARDKDQQLLQEQAMHMRTRGELTEAQQEATRFRDDLNRQALEWSAKLDRNLALLEDTKRQRNHLTELNDKLTRDKDSIVAERKKLFDDLRQAVAERNREKDEAAEEINALKRDVDRFRSMYQEKERIINAQLLEERRAKDTLHAKLLELEGNTTKGVKSLDVQLRAQQDEHRHVCQRLQDQLHKSEADLRRANQEIDELRAMLGNKSERDRFNQQQEYEDHVYRLRKELDDTLLLLRNAESARDLAVRDGDRYREELQNASAIVTQWKAAKEKAESQNHQLTTTISLLMESDDGHANEKGSLKAQVEEQDVLIRQLQSELEQTYEMEQRFKDLLEENERLSAECTRISRERDELIDENGKMATEVLKWRDEVKEMLLRNNKIGYMGSSTAGGVTRPSTTFSTSIGFGRR